MANERLTSLDMTTQEAALLLAGGNPGAIIVCARLMNEGEAIDPDSALGGFGNLLELDTLNIWKDRIWGLFADVCREDITSMVAVLRATQLGELSREDVYQAIDTRGCLDLEKILATVQERLPEFAKTRKAEASISTVLPSPQVIAQDAVVSAFEQVFEPVESSAMNHERPTAVPVNGLERHAQEHPGIWLGTIAAGLVLLGLAGFTNFGGYFENTPHATEGK